MNKGLFILTAFAMAGLFACKQDPKSAQNTPAAAPGATPAILEGHWIAMDFCSRANQYGSVLQAMNYAHLPYAYAFGFDADMPDSVTCYNGIETWNLAAVYKADTIELKNARPGKSIFLVYDSQDSKNITLFDATTENAQMDVFIKSRANARNAYAAFQTALNHNLFNGTFTLLGKGVKSPVQFTPGGLIQNLPGYDRYVVCTAGDCFLSGDAVDVVTFYNTKAKDTNKFFGFKYSAQNDTLTIFNMIDTNPEEKGAYKVGSVAYKFLRKQQE